MIALFAWSKLGPPLVLLSALFLAPRQGGWREKGDICVAPAADRHFDMIDFDVSAGYLATSTFAQLLAEIDFSDAERIESFEKKLDGQKGLLSVPEYYYLQGRISFARNDFADSVRQFGKALATTGFAKRNPDVYYYLVIDYSKMGKLEKAEALLSSFQKQATVDDPLLQETELAVNALRSRMRGPVRSEPRRVFISESRPPAPAPPARAPSRQLAELGSESSLVLGSSSVMLDELGGKLLLLHFWASWCGPCAWELPSLIGFTSSKDFLATSEIVPVFITVDNFVGEGREFLRSKSLVVPELYWDPEMNLLRRLTGGVNVPVTIIYDPRKRLIVKTFPAKDWKQKGVREEVLDSAAPYVKRNNR